MGTILLTIQTKNRELEGKIWLLTRLLDRGHQVVFGDKRARKEILDIVKPDYCFISGIKSEEDSWLKTLTQNGVRVGVLESEGAVFTDLDEYGANFNETNLENIDYYFSWGPVQTNHLTERFPEYNEKFVTTGNPRFDLLTKPLNGIYSIPNMLIENLQPFVLVNTNFTQANYYSSPFEGNQNPSKSIPQSELLLESIKGVQLLADEFTEITFVVRPHPSESKQIYQDRLTHFDNIVVEDKYDVRNWIYKSEVVVHNGCTTGIESAIMKKPTIAYDPVDGYSPPQLPNKASLRCDSYKELNKAIYEIFNKQGNKDIHSVDFLKEWFHNLTVNSSAKLICEYVDDSINSSPSPDFSPSQPSATIKSKRIIKNIPNVGLLRNLYRKIFEKDITLYKKLPYIKQSEITDSIKRFNKFKNCPDYQIKRLNEWDDLFIITPKYKTD